jgi:hypothetical protein
MPLSISDLRLRLVAEASTTGLRLAGNRNRGGIIMNPIQKAATAAMALAITLAGATLATAPLALADVHARASHPAVSVSCLAPVGAVTSAPRARHG